MVQNYIYYGLLKENSLKEYICINLSSFNQKEKGQLLPQHKSSKRIFPFFPKQKKLVINKIFSSTHYSDIFSKRLVSSCTESSPFKVTQGKITN